MTRTPTPHRVLMAVLMALAMSGSQAGAADWPRFLGPDGNSIAGDTGINTNWAAKAPHELWRVPMTDGGFSGPAVAAGVVYLHDHDQDQDVVRALDLATGNERWRFAYDEPGRDNNGTTRATPTVQDGTVYAVSRYGTVHALAADTGTPRWSANPLKTHGGRMPEWEMAASAVIDGERVLIVAGAPDVHIVGLDRQTGNEIWKGGPDATPGYATPVITELDGKRQYLVFGAEALFGIDAATGSTLWTFPWTTQYGVNAGAPIPIDAQHVWIATGYRKGAALLKVSGATAEAVWTAPGISPHWGSAVRNGGFLYITTAPGFLVCVNEQTGEEAWRSKGVTGGFEHGGLCAVDGTLIVVEGNKGGVVQAAMTPTAYCELGRIEPFQSARCWTAPVVADRKLLVRSPTELVCLDLTQ
jgi:outer membrane protein assembly factor BamB